jgi:hypothetical protein
MRTALRWLLVFNFLLLAGCFVDPTAILGEAVAAELGITKESIFLRIINKGDSTQEIQIRVDDELITLPQCAPATGSVVCDSVITDCPTTIELVQETRFDLDGGFAGGRSFDGNEEFIFRRGEFECGASIVFEFTDTTATATILN